MRILITNDDGITEDGIVRLAKHAIRFGEVWVVAPKEQRSAESHRITLRKPLDIYPYDFPVEGVHAFHCSGTPADCIRVGSLGVMPEKPDVVLAGINHGYNVATDTQYSATVGAAFEGAFQGCLSVALSEDTEGNPEVTEKFIDEILERLLSEKPPYGHIYNVNFPTCPLGECGGVLWNREVSRGVIYRDTYNAIEALENGGKKYMVHGEKESEAEEGTDLWAVFNNYVSVSLVNNVGVSLGNE